MIIYKFYFNNFFIIVLFPVILVKICRPALANNFSTQIDWQPKRQQYPKTNYLDFNDKHCLLLRELTTVPKSKVMSKNLQGISMMSAKLINKWEKIINIQSWFVAVSLYEASMYQQLKISDWEKSGCIYTLIYHDYSFVTTVDSNHFWGSTHLFWSMVYSFILKKTKH